MKSHQKRTILVFHCEFSSERGPRQLRYLRACDRTRNPYPKLHYPEIYLLYGGYKEMSSTLFWTVFRLQYRVVILVVVISLVTILFVELLSNRSSLKVIETCVNHQTTCQWRMRTMSTSTKCLGRKRTNKVSLWIAHFLKSPQINPEHYL